jgi:hypothetical protein
VIEGSLERPTPTAAAAATPASSAAPAAPPRLGLGIAVVPVPVAGLVLLGLGVESRGHECVVLRAQVLLGRPERGLAVTAGRIRRRQIVLALEPDQLSDAHLELVRDPRIGATLTHPGPDLVQLGL